MGRRGLWSTWFGVCVLTCALAACGGSKVIEYNDPNPDAETRSPQDAPQSTVMLELDEPATGKLVSVRQRPRYRVKILTPGKLNIRLSWNNQDGLDRILVQGGTLKEIVVLDGRQKLKLNESLDVGPGFYTLELIAGPQSASYNLVASHTP